MIKKAGVLISGKFENQIMKEIKKSGRASYGKFVFVPFVSDDGERLTARLDIRDFNEIVFDTRYVLNGSIGYYRAEWMSKEESETFIVVSEMKEELTGRLTCNMASIEGYFMPSEYILGSVHAIAVNKYLFNKVKVKYIQVKTPYKEVKGNKVIVKGAVKGVKGNVLVDATEMTSIKEFREEMGKCVA